MEEWTLEIWQEVIKTSKKTYLFIYTPMCGTCQVGEKMLKIISTMRPTLTIGKMNVTYVRQIVEKYEIESVPCLLILENVQLKEKIYAFQSVTYLAEKII